MSTTEPQQEQHTWLEVDAITTMVNGDVRAVDARISGLVAAQHANVVHGCIRPLLKATKQIIRLEAGEGKVTCKRQKTKDKREREREREGERGRERERERTYASKGKGNGKRAG